MSVASCAARGFLIDEPAVEAVVLGGLDHLVGDRERIAIALHEVVHPVDLPAERGRRQIDVAEHGHAVPVRGVDDSRIRRKDQPFTRRAAPEHELIDVLPVIERVVILGRRTLRRIERRRCKRDERLHTAFVEMRVRVDVEIRIRKP